MVSPTRANICVSNTASEDSASTSSSATLTVSQKKLCRARVSLETTEESDTSDGEAGIQHDDSTANATPEGYRLIDLACLSDALSNAHKCPHGKARNIM